MASIESRILKALNDEMQLHMKRSFASPMVGTDSSIAYHSGLRLGIYKGMDTALQLIAREMDDTARKDELL